MDKKKVTVSINGIEYIITGDEAEEEIFGIASYVDKKIKELTSINSKLNPTYASVLCSLNTASELLRLKGEMELSRSSLQEMEKQFVDLKAEYSEALKENAKLEERLDSYKKGFSNDAEELKGMKEQYENLYNDYIGKNNEQSKLYRENDMLKREKENKQKELEKVKMELSDSKDKLIEMQNQLLQNQIDLVKTRKELDEFKMNYNKTRDGRKI